MPSMSSERSRERVEDIIEAITLIRSHLDGISRSAFVVDVKTQDAVVRRLEVIGEAARGLPTETTARHPYIPWQDVVNMRHRLAHEYRKTDPAIVWATCSSDLEPLLSAMLAEKAYLDRLTPSP